MEFMQKILFVLLGMIIAVGIFCLVVTIGSAVNGLTFGEQIVDWFGKTAPIVENATNSATIPSV